MFGKSDALHMDTCRLLGDCMREVARHEGYVSMNPLRSEARGRTKSDLHGVQHVYLDLDNDGDRAVAAMQAREDLPTPNHLIGNLARTLAGDLAG